jgi:hypothetical protein
LSESLEELTDMPKRMFPAIDGREVGTSSGGSPALPTLQELFCRKPRLDRQNETAVEAAENEGMPVLNNQPG